MKVVRSKTFQKKDGTWEKVEVELDSSDLLDDEKSCPEVIQPQLLEVRADKAIYLMMERIGTLSQDEVLEECQKLDEYRKTLLKVKPKPKLRKRGQ